MLLPIDRPAAVVGMQDRDIRPHDRPRKHRTCLGELLTKLLNLGVERNGRTVGSDQSAVIFLLTIERAAPLPVAHRVSAVTDRVPRHRTHFALVQCIVDGRPVH